MSKRDNHLVLSHALTQVFVSFLVKDAVEVIHELVKVNEELRLTWEQIIKASTSKTDIENTYVRLQSSRGSGDILTTLSKYTTESKNIYGMKINDHILNSPFAKTADDTVLAELEKCLNNICVDVYNGYKNHNSDYHTADFVSEKWFLFNLEGLLSDQYVDGFIKFAAKHDSNDDNEKGYEFSVVESMIEKIFYVTVDYKTRFSKFANSLRIVYK